MSSKIGSISSAMNRVSSSRDDESSSIGDICVTSDLSGSSGSVESANRSSLKPWGCRQVEDWCEVAHLSEKQDLLSLISFRK